MEFPTFFPTTLDEARENWDCPPMPADSLLGTWTERVLSIQQHTEYFLVPCLWFICREFWTMNHRVAIYLV